MDYRFAGDFTKAPLGPFTAAAKKLVWDDPVSAGVTTDSDPNGLFFNMVEDGRFPGRRACRQKYPKGEHGTNSKQYYVRYKNPGTIANLEYSMLFEAGFSFMTPNPEKWCVGKVGPQINWGEVGGPTEGRGSRSMWIWNGGGSNYPNPKLCPAGQDQRTGAPLISPPVYGPRIETERLYKLRSQFKGGPGGFMKWWLDDQLIASMTGNYQVTATDDVIFDFSFWSGGASWQYAPEHDSYALCGGVRIWSGEDYWEDTGNGGGDSTDGGGDTGPPPPDGVTTPYRFAVGEKRIFRAMFLDNDTFEEIPAQGNVKWTLNPNVVSWGAQAGPMWSALEVTGKTVGKAMLSATDDVTGISTIPIEIEVTPNPEPAPPEDLVYVIGTCRVEMP